MDFSGWLNMLRLVFGQGVVRSFQIRKGGLTLNCGLKRAFVIEVSQIDEETVVAVVNERSYRSAPTWLELLNDIDRLYNQ